MKYLVVPHNPEWASVFAQAHQELTSILHATPPISILHVGSTSIPDLVAKPVIDIDIVVKPENVSVTQAALVSAGYVDLGDWGIPERIAFRQPGYDENTGDGSNAKPELGMRRNTYVMIEGSTALRNHRDVKRILLEDEELRKEYGEVKMRLADADGVSKDAYNWGKTDVAVKILRKAGWSGEELVEVERSGNS